MMPQYKGFLNGIALSKIEQRPDIPKSTLGCFPYENLDSIKTVPVYKVDLSQKVKRDNPKYDDKKLNIYSPFGDALAGGY